MQSSWFRKSRFKSGKGKAIAVGGAGLGYKERPGFGAAGASSSSGNNSNNFPSNDSKSNNEGSSNNTASNRFAAMRDTFRSQYLSQVRIEACRTFFSLIDHWKNLFFQNSSEHRRIELGKKMYLNKLHHNQLQGKIQTHLLCQLHRVLRMLVKVKHKPIAYTMTKKKRKRVAGTE